MSLYQNAPSGSGRSHSPQADEFKYLRVLFTSDGRIERWIETLSAVIRVLVLSVMVNKTINLMAKFSIYWSMVLKALTPHV